MNLLRNLQHDELSDSAPWIERVQSLVTRAHEENWGGKHGQGFCEACADAYLVAQYAVPGAPGEVGYRARRDDDVARWLKTRRDSVRSGTPAWYVIDNLLGDYRCHADTGTALGSETGEP